MTIRCPTCGKTAEHMVYRGDSHTFPAGPAVTICHARDAAYVHVEGDD